MLNPEALQWKVSPSTLMQHKPAFALMTLFSHAPVKKEVILLAKIFRCVLLQAQTKHLLGGQVARGLCVAVEGATEFMLMESRQPHFFN